MDKVVRGNMVAVLYSPGYGAGWSTWAGGKHSEEIVFDPGLVALVEEKEQAKTDKEKHRISQKIERYAEQKWPDIYTGGLEQITIYWLQEGTSFRIDEYDGSERITLTSDLCFTT